MKDETKTATDAEKAAQEKRSKKYSIGIKDDTNVTKPPEFKDVPDSEWGDPVNYRYPMADKTHADDAASRWGDNDNRVDYSSDEQTIISDRITKRQESFGEDEGDKSADTSETANPVEPETKQPEPAPIASRKAPDSTDRPQLEYKTLAFKATPASADNGLQENEFEGYAAAFANLDSWYDIIEKGAFVAGLDDYLQNGTVCWQHDWSTPIGKPLAASEDDKGLFLKGRISLTTAGKDALTLLRDDVVTKLSIGYIATASRTLTDEEGAKLFGETDYARILKSLPWYMEGIRVITEIKLFEVSLVTVPANDQAVITAVKDGSHAGLTLDEQFTSVLAAVGDYSARVKGLVDLRAKAGRTLSASNRQKLQDMRDSLQDHCDDLDEMIASATPADTDPDEGEGSYDSAGKSDPEEAARKADEARDELRREWLRFQKSEARLHGVDL